MPNNKVIDNFSDERGRVDMRRLQVHLTSSGLLPSVQPLWREQIGKIKYFEGLWLNWSGAVGDKAFRVLDVWRRPATPEEIVAAIEEEHAPRSASNQMKLDDRFVRVNKTQFGLRAWGMEEYSTIADGIYQEIERQGGLANINDLVSSLIDRFDSREQSIRVYFSAPMFVIEDGTIRLRTKDEPHDPVPSITDTVDCSLFGPEALSWRVDVTDDTLRGSGRKLPPAIAAWLGVLPGRYRSLTAVGWVVGVSWPESSANGPSLGSIRFLAERVGGQAGDQVILIFRRDQGTISVTKIDDAIVPETGTWAPEKGGADFFQNSENAV